MDVDATWDLETPHVLADDFECNVTGPLTNITIWGSWYHDHYPWFEDPNAVAFTLSIHKDIPADESPTGYSMPGDVIWYKTFGPGDFMAMLFADGLAEGWYDPYVPYYESPGDSQCWMYSFDLEVGEFIQEGTSDNPVVYWLDVQAQPMDQNPECRFGWKTSVNHWNDNAVWGIGYEPYPGPWNELYHPENGEQIDMAFAITGMEHPNILLDLQVFFEGPYNGTDMNTDLNAAGVLPLAQPYDANNSAPWYYTGAETVSSIPNGDIVDWILIELRETPGGPASATGGTMIAQKAAFIKNDGSVVALDGSSDIKFYVTITQNLFVVVYHRTHLGIMSATPLIGVGNLYSYDFTSGASQAYLNGQKNLGGTIYGMFGGDCNPDGNINVGDYVNVWSLEVGTTGYKAGDCNLDVQVDNKDKNDIWVPNIGTGSQIP